MDKTIAAYAARNDGFYEPREHYEVARMTGRIPGGDVEGHIEAHVRRLEALRRAGIVGRLDADHWDIPRDFLERASLLGERLGCVLFQCPPTLKYDRGLAEAFVGYLPPGVRFAMEFRHPSWAQARDLLSAQGVAWCVAETDEKDPGPNDLSWEPFGFLRLRKSAYTDEEFAAWADRIRPALDSGSDVFCYFKHEDEGASPQMAKRLEEVLGQTG